MPLSEITKIALFDAIVASSLRWSGRFEESQFLGRLYRLNELPSTDYRFKDAEGDIYQHTVNNHDWEEDWVFYDGRFELKEDDKLFRFLCETVHPVVRMNRDEALHLVGIYNEHLRHDGYELAQSSEISGRPVYTVRETRAVPSALSHVETIVQVPDMISVLRQIRRMERNIESDPELAIGSAKELVESICHLVFSENRVEPNPAWDFSKMVKETAKLLKVTPDDFPDTSSAANSIRQILGSLGTIVGGIAHLRNSYGTGHGRAPGSSGLGPRHARLAVGAASTLAIFLYETFDARRQSP
jgi:hypothetical protein